MAYPAIETFSAFSSRSSPVKDVFGFVRLFYFVKKEDFVLFVEKHG